MDPTLAWIIWAIRLISTSVVVSHFTPFLFLGLCGSHPYFIFKILLPKKLISTPLAVSRFRINVLSFRFHVCFFFFLSPEDIAWITVGQVSKIFNFKFFIHKSKDPKITVNNKRDSTVYIFHKISLHTLTYFLVLDLYWSVQHLEFDPKKM